MVSSGPETVSDPFNDPRFVHPASHHTHRESDRALSIFVLLFLFMLVAQCGIYYWKKTHNRSYLTVTLLGLWLIPPMCSVHLLYRRMLIIWSIFSIITGHITFKATRKPLDPATPRAVYSWFYTVYRACYGAGVLGYSLLMLEYFNIAGAFGLNHELSAIGGLVLFYGLYLGVLCRDAAERCADTMATSIGYYRKDDCEPEKVLMPNICAICNHGLWTGGEEEGTEQQATEKIITLGCKHQFHEFCIRGWSIVGKKDMCPYCCEKVNLKQLIASNPWETQSLLWAHLLDALRYLIVWNPVILIATQAVLYTLGYR